MTVPGGAAIGSARMQVRVFINGATPACGPVSYGEAEDYCITVVACNGCPVTLAVPGVIANGICHAAIGLSLDGIVPNANPVTFKAGTSILLEPESELQLGATFDALIGGCVPFAPPSQPAGEKQRVLVFF